MIIQTLPNKSICVTSDMPHEAETVAQYRQFSIGERVLCFGTTHTILAVETVVKSQTIQNVYTLSVKHVDYTLQVTEYVLLGDNARPAPNDIFDLLVDCLPRVIPFADSNNVFVTGV